MRITNFHNSYLNRSFFGHNNNKFKKFESNISTIKISNLKYISMPNFLKSYQLGIKIYAGDNKVSTYSFLNV